MIKIIGPAVIVLFWVFTGIVAAQTEQIKFEHLSIEQGLSQSAVICIQQDRDGFFWFGTEDGLNKFDGYHFTIFRHQPDDDRSLSGNSALSIYQDNTGTLWIGTNNGLNRYDPLSQKFICYRNNLGNTKENGNNFFRAIYQDQQGHLWLGSNDGLYQFDRDSNSFTAFRHDPNQPGSISNDRVRAIYQDRVGTLWIATVGGGLNKFDPSNQTFIAYRHDPNNANSISSDEVTVLCEDQTGILWVGTADGLNQFDRLNQRFTSYRNDPQKPDSLSSNTIYTIYQDNTGLLWVGTDGGGLNIFDRQRESFISYRNNPNQQTSIGGDNINAIYQDRAGTLWFGTNGGGVSKYDRNSQHFNTVQHNPAEVDSLSSNKVLSFYQNQLGTLWVGTDGGGLNRFDADGQRHQGFRHDPNHPGSISSDVVYAIYQDRAGILWLGSQTGLNRFQPDRETFTLYQHDPNNSQSISSNLVFVIYPVQDGTFWIGTGRGLNRFDPDSGRFTAYRHDPNNPNSISDDDIRAIYQDHNGQLWVGTRRGGLNRFDPDRNSFISFRNNPNDPTSISSNSISVIQEDQTGALWLGTLGGGLNRFDREREQFTTFRAREGLPNDTIYGILVDRAGFLWLSTNNGIARFDPRNGQSKNYDVGDGLQSNEFNSFAYYQSDRGEFFFGGIKGFNRFWPAQISDNAYLPPVFITAFNVLDQPVPPASFARLTGLINDQPLTLSYRENVVSFEFAALNFTHAEKNQYRYRLEGVDPDWINSGTRRYARYTNLSPGQYLFRVQGSNNDGRWNQAGCLVKLIIEPPPWRTWWAYLLYFIGLTSLGFGGYHFRLRALRRRLQLERAIEIGKKNQELESKNIALAQQKEQLAEKNAALIASQQRADRIFSALADALPGTVLDEKYRLDEKIGAGGFGAVYRATHLAMKRAIAVKVFKPAPGNDSVEALERFQLEAISACRINHPNAVQVLDSGVSSEGIAYLVMELLKGYPLTQLLRAAPVLPAVRAVQIVAPICNVLAQAHQAGILHRDIKPDNIFLHRNGETVLVKLVDFGIAKLMAARASIDIQQLTATGGIIGTPTYMAPERLEGKQYDGRSDVYSLGVLLYEILTGQPPFGSGRISIFEIIHQHLTTRPRPLREINPQIDPAVAELVMQMLAKAPQDRPTAQALAEQLLTAVAITPDQLATMEWHWLPEIISDGLTDQTRESDTIPLPIDSTTRLKQAENFIQALLAHESERLGDDIRPASPTTEARFTEAQWRRIEEIFNQAIELAPELRADYLAAACEGDEELRRQVELLITNDTESD